jgi:hypothetical protein
VPLRGFHRSREDPPARYPLGEPSLSSAARALSSAARANSTPPLDWRTPVLGCCGHREARAPCGWAKFLARIFRAYAADPPALPPVHYRGTKERGSGGCWSSGQVLAVDSLH